jgi:hypothetical protein
MMTHGVCRQNGQDDDGLDGAGGVGTEEDDDGTLDEGLSEDEAGPGDELR